MNFGEEGNFKEKRKNGFLTGAGLLAGSVVIAKILGAAYRIPLANILGAEGMGLYQFVYPVFALLLTLSGGAIPTAVSITVSGYLAKNDENGAKKSFVTVLELALITGFCGMILLFSLAYPLSLIQNRKAVYGYFTVAPAVFIVTLISVFRGWFMGHNNLVPGSISHLTEGIVKLSVGITLAKILLPRGVEIAVAGALCGVAAGELVTLIILFAIFIKKDGAGFIGIKSNSRKPEIKAFIKLISPLVLCGVILPFSQFIDSVLLVNLLRWGGEERSAATALYGVLSGAVTPLINLPVMVCISLGIAVTPRIVEGKERRDVDFIMDKCRTATKMTFVLGVPFVFFFLLMSEATVAFFFPGLGAERLRKAGDLLKIMSASVLGLSLFQIYSAILQGLGKTMVPVKIMSVCVVIKTILCTALVPSIGINGAGIGCLTGYLLAGVSIMVYFFNYVRKSDELLKNAGLIILCGVIMGAVVLIAGKLFTSSPAVVIVGGLSFAVYGASLFLLRVFTPEELASLPLGKYLVKFDRGIRSKNDEF